MEGPEKRYAMVADLTRGQGSVRLMAICALRLVESRGGSRAAGRLTAVLGACMGKNRGVDNSRRHRERKYGCRSFRGREESRGGVGDMGDPGTLRPS
jgi:hypothetical protein